jgi:hypothetical protein
MDELGAQCAQASRKREGAQERHALSGKVGVRQSAEVQTADAQLNVSVVRMSPSLSAFDDIGVQGISSVVTLRSL